MTWRLSCVDGCDQRCVCVLPRVCFQVPLSRGVYGSIVVGLGAERAQDFPGDDHHGQGALRAHPVAGRQRTRRGPEYQRILKNRNFYPSQADDTKYVDHFYKGCVPLTRLV